MEPYKLDNWMHVFACSNSNRALKLSHQDRRWFVPKITSKKLPPEWWEMFNNWLTREEGLSIIRRWCDERAQDGANIVREGEEAPNSATKKEMVVDGYGDEQRFTHDLLALAKDAAEAENKPLVLLDLEVTNSIKSALSERPGGSDGRTLSPKIIRDIAEELGYVIGERITLRTWDGFEGDVKNCRPMMSDPRCAELSVPDLMKAHRPQRTNDLARKLVNHQPM
jgi:hypothetical protein